MTNISPRYLMRKSYREVIERRFVTSRQNLVEIVEPTSEEASGIAGIAAIVLHQVNFDKAGYAAWLAASARAANQSD